MMMIAACEIRMKFASEREARARAQTPISSIVGCAAACMSVEIL